MTTCDTCGRVEHDATAVITWTVSFERGRRRATCLECSREHLRAMEGKLDPEWW